jgi:adenylate cyclase
MGREVERKFLVQRDRWNPGNIRPLRIRQGYLSLDPERVVRIRAANDDAFVTIKGRTRGIERAEFEYPIPLVDADRMLDQLCLKPLIVKLRYRIPYGGHTWEVDVFDGENAGLVLAEVELRTADEAIDHPPWLADDVSGDPRFYNANLVTAPYRRWGSQR